MIKNLGKILVKGLILLGLFFLAIMMLEPLFSESKKSVWSHFYDQKENTIDVLILGNSHANAAIDNAILEANLDVNVVSLATRGQNIYQSYYCALEAYKNQVPEVLIIENFLFYERLTMDAFVNQDPELNDYKKRYLTFEGKKFSSVKLEESQAFFKGNIIENMFPAIKNHQKWTNIEAVKERLYLSDTHNRIKGTTVMSSASVKAYKNKTNFDLKKYNLLPDEEKALKQIVDLALKKGTKKIIMLTAPFYKDYRNKIDYKSLNDPITKFSNEYSNVSYIDLNSIYSDLDHTYFSNDPVGYNQHLNYKGAIKVSNYLVSVLKTMVKPNEDSDKTLEYYLYNKLERAKTENNNSIIVNLETLNNSNGINYTINQGDSPVLIEGWMTIEDLKADKNEMFIGLVKDDGFVFITSQNQITPLIRKDVTKYFDKEAGFYDNSGFRARINSDLLEKGFYYIYLMIKRNDEIVLKKSYKAIQIN